MLKQMILDDIYLIIVGFMLLVYGIVIGVAIISVPGPRLSKLRYFYHGSYQHFDVLEPQSSGVIDGEKAVFATDSYADAVLFSAQWSDYDFNYSVIDDKKYITEMYPGAFEKLDRTGYIHYVDSEQFHRDDRLGLDDEFICKRSVKTFKHDRVNVKKYLTTTNYHMITFSKYMRNLRTHKVQRLLPKLLTRKVSAIYVPIDKYWRPDVGINVIHFDRMSNRELEIAIKNAPNGVILMGSIIGTHYTKEFKDIPIHVLVPKEIKYHGSKKTTKAEYMKYITARLELLSEYPTMVI